ncbi:hypothetical protein GH714_044108 [Hevea brasiliensis]|uniref:Uncharacterized protein n=1 Tax=Hevea brasiliensis TaxID=3981 RepID=A0A6A6K281_HEVBR|nr:hypothetical protein GH714_044108 [Hevea brasiliensis]
MWRLTQQHGRNKPDHALRQESGGFRYVGFATIYRICKKVQLVGFQNYYRGFFRLRFTFYFNGDIRMTLLELLVQELPKRGGWPNCACVAKSYSHIPDVLFWDDNGITVPFHSLSRDAVGNYCVTREHYEATLAASKQPEWDGDGLPPVGTKCEFINDGVNYRMNWIGVIILAYGDEKVFMRHAASKNEFAETLAALRFRLARTEAERKREEAIEQMMERSAVWLRQQPGFYMTPSPPVKSPASN